MALSEDQKAILRLLAQRGEQGYADLAALMGIEVGEVHAKALAAASQLEAEGIPAPAIPSPPGSSSPEAPAAKPEPEPTPEPVAAQPPPPPEPPKAEQSAPQTPTPAPAAPTKRAAPRRPKPTLPEGGGARAAIAAGALVLVALVVVLIVGGGDSGETNGSGSGEGTAAEETVNTNAGGGKEVTQAILGPVDGSDAQGTATFGRVKNSLALQLQATGLEPTAKGESYTIWLYESARKMLPLASTRVAKSGKIGVQVEVPTEVLAYLANETFDQIDVSLTSDAALKASLAKATSEKKAPIYTGTDVLRGRITGPIIGASR